MKSQLRTDLLRLPALGASDGVDGAVKCKICSNGTRQFDIVDFNKVCGIDYYCFGLSGIPVTYYKCQNCGFIFTDFCDDWTTEDFATFIYNSDYPLVDGEYTTTRPARMAGEMASFLADHRSARILDYGSGTGTFAEGLKERGFTAVENYDPFSSPERPSGAFDIITCFETIEHSPCPNDTIADLLGFMKPDGCIILSTGIQPANINELRANWWYIGPRNGHISIYTLAALELLGAGVGLELYSGEGKLAFAGRTLSAQLVPLLRAIGPTRVFAQLTAPADQPIPRTQPEALAAARSADWHAIEQSGPTRFRWTRTGRVEWTLKKPPTNYPCRLTLTIPFVMEIIPGFADRCLLEIGSRTYPVRREEATITATAELAHALPQPIALITPEPQRPSDLRETPDHRALGLAVPLAAETA